MALTTFKAGNALAIGDVVHPAEGPAVRVVHVLSRGADRMVVSFDDGRVSELDAADVVEVEIPSAFKAPRKFRGTRPNAYERGSAGYSDCTARQGYYAWALDEESARREIRERMGLPSTERIDLEDVTPRRA